LFSSAMTIPDTAACIEAVMLLEKSEKLVKKLWDNADYFKSEMTKLGYDLGRTQTPIMPVMLGEAKTAQKFSQHLFEKGIFAMAIGYPTVPKGKARIRVMISASHDKKHLDDVLEAFDNVGKKLKVTKR
ncbi:MAG: aminotransferase class I/II-fold pyridoxal phosphate-dependent enzyme, partial [Candidatus Woesebacteria bacterium]